MSNLESVVLEVNKLERKDLRAMIEERLDNMLAEYIHQLNLVLKTAADVSPIKELSK